VGFSFQISFYSNSSRQPFFSFLKQTWMKPKDHEAFKLDWMLILSSCWVVLKRKVSFVNSLVVWQSFYLVFMTIHILHSEFVRINLGAEEYSYGPYKDVAAKIIQLCVRVVM